MTGGTFTQLDHQTFTNTTSTYTEMTGSLAVHPNGVETDFTNYVEVVLAAPGVEAYFDDISRRQWERPPSQARLHCWVRD